MKFKAFCVSADGLESGLEEIGKGQTTIMRVLRPRLTAKDFTDGELPDTTTMKCRVYELYRPYSRTEKEVIYEFREVL